MYCEMSSKNHKFGSTEITEILQVCPLLGSDKHQSPTATYVYNSRGTVGGDVFLLVPKKVI